MSVTQSERRTALQGLHCPSQNATESVVTDRNISRGSCTDDRHSAFNPRILKL